MTDIKSIDAGKSDSGSSESKQTLRVVDLFCGCGGLALGFGLNRGNLEFKTVLGIDNELAATKVFNDNHHPVSSSRLQLGRLADVTWFAHPDEIRLFYLTHVAEVEKDAELQSALSILGINSYLHSIRACDEEFKSILADLADDEEFITAATVVPKQTSVLALVRASVGKLGLSSFCSPSLDPSKLPWTEEYQSLAIEDADYSKGVQILDIAESTRELWDDVLAKLLDASTKAGRGQHKNNSERLVLLTQFLETAAGNRLRDAWVTWRSTRDSIRARFCLTNSDEISNLYLQDSRANIVLGGPPCKGFSRMGRPVIANLRNQGVHAWSHKDYGDERNALMVQYVLFLEALQPDVFLFENVANFQSTLKTPNGTFHAPDLLIQLIDELSEGELHYHANHKLVNARHFGIPQDRRRFIMIGVNAAKAESTAVRTFFEFGEPAQDVPLSQALVGLSEPAEFDPKNGVKSDHLTSTAYLTVNNSRPESYRKYSAWISQTKPKRTDAHIYRCARPDDKAFIKFVGPGIRWMDLKVNESETLNELQDVLDLVLDFVDNKALNSRIKAVQKKANSSLMLRLLLEHTITKDNLDEQHLLLESYLKNGGSTHGDWLERLSASKPCRTIVAHIGKDTYAYWHPYEPRAITIREAARVQSFPDFFKFGADGVVDAYSVIGNAVPPLMANEFAKRLEALHKRHIIFHDEDIESEEQPSLPKLQLALTV